METLEGVSGPERCGREGSMVVLRQAIEARRWRDIVWGWVRSGFVGRREEGRDSRLRRVGGKESVKHFDKSLPLFWTAVLGVQAFTSKHLCIRLRAMDR